MSDLTTLYLLVTVGANNTDILERIDNSIEEVTITNTDTLTTHPVIIASVSFNPINYPNIAAYILKVAYYTTYHRILDTTAYFVNLNSSLVECTHVSADIPMK